jgi:ATP-dependent Clp protease protease subunit
MPATELYLTLDGPISDQNVAQLIQQLDPIINPGNVEHLYLLLSTPGGSVNAGVTLFNYLEGLPIPITTHNIGQVDSIGNVIFQAGNKRIASHSTSFLFHGVTFSAQGTIAMSRVQLEELLSQIKQDEKRISTILKDKTNLNGTKLNAFFKSGRSLDPNEALTFGIIDRIAAVSIPNDAQRAIVNTYPAQP